MTHDPWQFIRRQATAMGVSDAAIYKWRKRGIPHRYRLPLLQRAAASGVSIQFDPLLIVDPASDARAA